MSTSDVDLIEIVHTGVAGSAVSKRRLWSGGELAAVEGCEQGAGLGWDGVCVVESYFDDHEAESEYWAPPSGKVLTQTAVDWGSGPVWWSVDRTMLDAYAPVGGVPDATFFARLELLGLALDPAVSFGVDVRVEDGFPVGGDEPTRAPAVPEVVITGNVDEVLSWCTGKERLIDLPSQEMQGLFACTR